MPRPSVSCLAYVYVGEEGVVGLDIFLVREGEEGRWRECGCVVVCEGEGEKREGEEMREGKGRKGETKRE